MTWDSGGVALFDPTVFKGTDVSRIAVTMSENGKAYIMNPNNLGEFKQGSGSIDNVLQTIVADGAIFDGSGSFLLEGGFIYFTPIGFPASAYKLGFDSNGKTALTKVGASLQNSAGHASNGVQIVTTYQAQAETAILWIYDVNNGLQAYSAVLDNKRIT